MTKEEGSSTNPLNKSEQENIVTAAKGGSIGFVGKLFVQGISLGFVYIMAQTFGAEQYGVYRLAILIATITAAVSLIGLDGGMKRYVAIARSEKNRNKLWGVIQLGVGLPAIIGLVLAFVIAVTAEPISLYIFKKPELGPILRLVSIAIPFLVIINSLKAVAIGFKKIQYNVYSHDLAFNILKLLFAAVVILLGFQIKQVTIAFIAAIAISVLIMLYFINKIFPFKKLPKHPERHDKEILAFSFPLFLSLLLNQFGRNFEALVLGVFGLLSDVGVYSVILTMSNVGNMGFVALRSISNPIFAELYNEGKIAELKSHYQTISKWSLTFNFPIFLTIVLFPENLLSIFGKDFSVGMLGLIILASGALFNAATGACGALLNMSGYSRMNFYNSIVYLVTTLILDFILIPKYGLVGAALAGGITVVLLNTLMMVEAYLLIDKILPLNRTFYKPVLAALVAGALAFAGKKFLFTDQLILQLAVVAGTMWLVYGLMLKALKLSPEDKFILQKVTKRGKKKKKKDE